MSTIKTKLQAAKKAPAAPKISEIRKALADYIASEGCGCCGRREEHTIAMNKLGKLLKMRKYKDGSGYDYSLYRTKTD
jgi:hypothetical protein